MRLHDKVAIVTGGARGIGAAIAGRYGAEGALVVIADVNEDGAQRAAAAIEAAGGRAFACGFDVTRQADIDRLLQTVAERAGGLDILVNNAGVFDMGPLLEISRERWDRLFEVNAKGLFFMLQAAARRIGLHVAGRQRRSAMHGDADRHRTPQRRAAEQPAAQARTGQPSQCLTGGVLAAFPRH